MRIGGGLPYPRFRRTLYITPFGHPLCDPSTTRAGVAHTRQKASFVQSRQLTNSPLSFAISNPFFPGPLGISTQLSLAEGGPRNRALATDIERQGDVSLCHRDRWSIVNQRETVNLTLPPCLLHGATAERRR
jgi:hypothetical protein